MSSATALIESDNGTKRKVREKLKKLDKKIEKSLITELDAIWNKILGDAITECPKITGTLASTIRIVEGAFGGMMGSHIAGRMIFNKTITAGDEMITKPSGEPCVYAQWVHDGFIHWKSGRWIVGHPFLDIAIERNMAELEEAIEKAMKNSGKWFGED